MAAAPTSVRLPAALALLLAAAARLPRSAAYPDGYVAPCPTVIGGGGPDAVPHHGRTVSTPGPFELSLSYDGHAVPVGYNPDAPSFYTLLLSGPGMRGFIVAAFAGGGGADALTSFGAPKAGSLVPAEELSQPMGACAGGLTHTSPEVKTAATFRWFPRGGGGSSGGGGGADAAGPVTFWAVVVTAADGVNYQLRLTVPQTALVPSPFVPGPQPSVVPPPSPSAQPAAGGGASATPTMSVLAPSTPDASAACSCPPRSRQ